MPTCRPAGISQVTCPAPGSPESASPPQQSEFFVHRSPVTWQPLAGWQTFTPEEPCGAHKRLQQSPQPLQTVPSTPEQKVEPEGGVAHVPTDAPLAIVHCPEQQSGSFEQMSPV